MNSSDVSTGAAGARTQDKICSGQGFSTALLARVIAACLCLALACVLWAGHAAAADETHALPELKGHVSAMEDFSSALTLVDILDPEAQARFLPVSGQDINFGYVHHAIWVKLAIPARTTGRTILSLTPNFLDQVDIYTASPGASPAAEDFALHRAGDHRPLPRDAISGLDMAVPVEFAADEITYVYVRILNTNSSSHLNLQLSSTEGRGRIITATASALGLWFGGMGAFLITQLVFFYFDRRAQYPLLAVSTLGVMLIYAGNLGYSHVFLFPGNGRANDFFIGFNAWAGLTAAALAYSSILDLRRKAPWLHRLYQFTAVVGIVGVGFALAGKNILFGPFGSVFGITMALVNMLQSLRHANSEGAASRLTAAAFTAVCLGAFLSMTQRLGVDWLPNWTSHSYGLAGLVQTILLTGALAVRLRDVEAQNRRMQEEALHSAQAAEQRASDLVVERTRELVQASKVAEEALQAEMQSQLRQVRFLEVVSHQYRTPLAAIRSSIDSIGLALPREDAANHGRIERIRRAVARLVEILEVNLARSRLQGPSFRPRLSRISAGDVVRSTVQRAHDLTNGAEIRVDMSPDASSRQLMADAGMLELAVLNLLENAVKYTAIKGESPILLSLETTAEEVAITVADSGIGIPATELAHVFKDSVRGSNVASTEGSGLGLFLVEKIVAAHGGEVDAQSQEGEGTTMRITLPACRAN